MRLKRLRKRSTVVLAVPMLVAALTATNVPASGAAIVRTTSHTDGDTQSVASSITEVDYRTGQGESAAESTALNGCAKTTGIAVNRTAIPPSQEIPKLLLDESSRTMPDLVMVDNPNMPQFAQAGALVPLSTFHVSTNGFSAGSLSIGEYHGTLYALPTVLDNLVLFYNKTMFAAKGLQPPTTWAQLKSDALALKTKTVQGFVFGATADGDSPWQFLPFFWSNGAQLNKLNSRAAVGALQYWVNLVKSGASPSSVVSDEDTDIANLFAAGDAAMVETGGWNMGVFNAAKGLSWGDVPIPVPKAGDKVIVPLGGEVWMIPQTSPAKEAAAAKILACITSPGPMWKFAINPAISDVPARTALANRLAKSNPAQKAFVKSILTAQSRAGLVGAQWPLIQTELWTAIQQAVTGSTSAQDALNSAQQQVSTAG